MNKYLSFALISFGVFIAIIIERSLIQVPLAYLMMSLVVVYYRNISVYVAIFILSLILDMVVLNSIGITSIILFLLILLINIYEKYSGSKDIVVSSVVISASGIIYAHYFSYSVIATVIIFLIGYLVWFIFYYFRRSEIRSL